MQYGARIAGLYARVTKEGTKFLSGKLAGTMRVFPNNRKKSDEEPDFFVYVFSTPAKKIINGDGE